MALWTSHLPKVSCDLEEHMVRKQQENRWGVGGGAWEQDSNQLVSIFLETNEIYNVQGLQPNN